VQDVLWFPLWVPLFLQLLVPLALVAGLSLWRFRTRMGWLIGGCFAVVYIWALWVGGLWLVLPWYLPIVYAVLFVPALWLSWRRLRDARGWPAQMTGRIALAAGAIATAVLAGVVVSGSADAPGPPAIDLAWPLADGTFLVVNGGDSTFVNAHLATLTGERARPYRGQSYGVDIVRLNASGLRAHGVLPSDPAAYAIFDQPVVAPCDGSVVNAFGEAPDLAPPTVDRAHMAGNHVILDCGGTWVLLGHLKRRSVTVHAGDRVSTGQTLGRVGNSGNTTEPHLHIHAQTPGTFAEPLSGSPRHFLIDGEDLRRNRRLRR
jgi:hypothetical protein